MRRLLLAAIATLGLSVTAQAQGDPNALSDTQWGNFVQNVVGAAECGLITRSQATGAVSSAILIFYGGKLTAGEQAIMGAAAAEGAREAKDPLYCTHYPAMVLAGIEGITQ